MSSHAVTVDGRHVRALLAQSERHLRDSLEPLLHDLAFRGRESFARDVHGHLQAAREVVADLVDLFSTANKEGDGMQPTSASGSTVEPREMFLNVHETAALLGMTRQGLRKRRARGDFPQPIQDRYQDRYPLWRRSDLVTYARGRCERFVERPAVVELAGGSTTSAVARVGRLRRGWSA